MHNTRRSRHRAALAVIAASLAAQSCAQHRHLPAYPAMPNHSSERDWFSATQHITGPSRFAEWEPVLEEMTGKAPLASDRVAFADKATVRAVCGMEAGGCFDSGENRILIDSAASPGEVEGHSPRGLLGISQCKSRDLPSMHKYPVILLWAHEQGHRYDRGLGDSDEDRWVDQVEAVAFEYYFAEHVARLYDRRLGLELARVELSSYTPPLVGESGARKEEDESSASREARAFSLMRTMAYAMTGKTGPDDMAFAHFSLFALIGSGFSSFGEAWDYINSSGNAAVASRIRANASKLVSGRERAEGFMTGMAGGRAERSVPVSELLHGVALGEPSSALLSEGELEIRYPHFTATFAKVFSGSYIGKIEGSDGQFALSVSFSPARTPDTWSLSVRDWSGQRLAIGRGGGKESAYEYSNSVLSDVPFCMSVEIESSESSRLHSESAGKLLRKAAAAAKSAGGEAAGAYAAEILRAVFP